VHVNVGKLLRPGKRLGNYVLQEKIGQGAFAEVWKATHHERPGRLAAIKIATNADFQRELAREGGLPDIDHPNVVPIVDADTRFADLPYVVMPYYPGGSLGDLIAKHRGDLPEEQVEQILRDILSGLAAAHERGIVHADIKPSNILLADNGRALISDFGLSRVGHATHATSSIWQSGSLGRERDAVAGTLPYMAPEVLGGAEPTPASDVYSVGLVLFEMLTGRRPQGIERPSGARQGLSRKTLWDCSFERACVAPGARLRDANEFLGALAPSQQEGAFSVKSHGDSRKTLRVGAVVTVGILSTFCVVAILCARPWGRDTLVRSEAHDLPTRPEAPGAAPEGEDTSGPMAPESVVASTQQGRDTPQAQSAKDQGDSSVPDHTYAEGPLAELAKQCLWGAAGACASGKYDLAISECNKAMGLRKRYAEAYVIRAQAYLGKGNVDRAIADCDQAIYLKPSYAWSYVRRAQAYFKRGDHDQAIADCTEAIALAGDRFCRAVAYCLRGTAYQQKHDYERAMGDYSEAIRRQPEWAEPYYRRADVYRERHEYDLAIADCCEAIGLKRDCAEAYAGRGRAYTAKGDYRRAIADCNEAMRLKPDLAEAYAGRAEVFYLTRDYERAVADLTDAIRLKPEFAEAYAMRAAAYLAKGDYERAIGDFASAIGLRPDYALAYFLRAEAHLQSGDYDRAIADLTQAIRLNPDDAEAYLGRAVGYYAKGERDRAVADWRKVLELDPLGSSGAAARDTLRSLGIEP
jgi:tetratricopeptide (TPR) repeat protein